MAHKIIVARDAKSSLELTQSHRNDRAVVTLTHAENGETQKKINFDDKLTDLDCSGLVYQALTNIAIRYANEIYPAIKPCHERVTISDQISILPS